MSCARFVTAASLLLPLACSASPANVSEEKSVAAPPCADPIVIAAFHLTQAQEFDRAQAVLATALKNPSTAVCAAEMAIGVEAARKQVPKSGPVAKAWEGLQESVLVIAFWLAIALALTLAVLAFGGMLRLLSIARRRFCKPAWRVHHVAPGSDAMIVKAWRNALASSPVSASAHANLLVMSGIPLPRTLITGQPLPADVDLFTGAPDIQGVSLSWIGRLVGLFLRYCRSPRRTLSVSVTAHEKSAIVTIEACDAKAKIREVTGSAVWTSDLDIAQEITKMAAALALKTNYLMADSASDSGLATLTRLHAGIAKLNAYSQANDPTALWQAAESFAAAGEAAGGDLRPVLYEGIAFELLEDHDKAQQLFTQIGGDRPITEQTSRLEMQAAYNLAVSHLRRYRAEEVARAAEIFARVYQEIESLPSAKRSADAIGLQAFARAARANAIAHYFIFWSAIGQTGPNDFNAWASADLAAKAQELSGWTREAEELAQRAEAALTTSYFLGEPILATQLRWLISNARGNLALNRADCHGPAGVTDKRQMLEQARTAFQTCETLIEPGVETLSNIATTLLRLDQPTRALAYTRRARSLNPRYEYAWLREYEVEEARGEREAMMTLLREAKTALGVIRIFEFKQKFWAAGVRFHDK